MSQQLKARLTFVCYKGLVDEYVSGKPRKSQSSVDINLKPAGYWISVDHSWEDFCKTSSFRFKMEQHAQLNVYLKKNAVLLRLDSLQDFIYFLNEFGVVFDASQFNILQRKFPKEVMDIFESRVVEKYDGIYLTKNGCNELCDRCLPWDLPSIVMFEPNFIIYRKMRDRYVERAAGIFIRQLGKLIDYIEGKDEYLQHRRKIREFVRMSAPKGLADFNQRLKDVVAKLRLASPHMRKKLINSLGKRKKLFFREKVPKEIENLLLHLAGAEAEQNPAEILLKETDFFIRRIGRMLKLFEGLQEKIGYLLEMAYPSKDHKSLEALNNRIPGMINLLGQISKRLSYLRRYLAIGDILAFIAGFSGDWLEAEKKDESFIERIKKEMEDLRQELVGEAEPYGEDEAYEHKVVEVGLGSIEKVA